MNDTALYLGVEIGGTKIQMMLGDGEGNEAGFFQHSVDRSAGAQGICRALESGMEAWRQEGKTWTRGGIGFGGPVDRQNGTILCSHQIAGWQGFKLKEWFEDVSGVPARVDNDANVAALGEAWKGAGIGKQSVFYVTLGSGVGGGYVRDGQIFHGQFPSEMEIGHVRLDREGTTVESRCSGWAMDQRIRKGRDSHAGSILAKKTAGLSQGEALFLKEALEAKDPWAEELLKELLDDLSFGLSHAVHLFNPEIILLGGGLSGLGERLRGGVEARLGSYLMEVLRPGPEIGLAALESKVVPIGAVRLASQVPG